MEAGRVKISLFVCRLVDIHFSFPYHGHDAVTLKSHAEIQNMGMLACVMLPKKLINNNTTVNAEMSFLIVLLLTVVSQCQLKYLFYNLKITDQPTRISTNRLTHRHINQPTHILTD